MNLPGFNFSLDIGFGAAKATFFDPRLVEKAVDRAEKEKLRWAGGYVRRVAISLIKDAPNSARPGNPPHSHVAFYHKKRHKEAKKAGKIKSIPKLKGPQRGIKYILFGLDAEDRGNKVIVGPVGFHGNGEVPHLTEFGGPAVRFVRGKRQSVRYSPHPFMGPALAKSQDKLVDIWAGSIK